MPVETPIISIALLTFNHAKFIDDALSGIMGQNALAETEIVVADDCSTDGTLTKVEAGLKSFPGTVRIIRRERNVGMMRNFVSLLNECRGKYIALLEGDDFWTVNEKLERQTRFFDSHPEAYLCHHRVSYLDDASKTVTTEFPPPEFRKALMSPALLSQGNFIQTCAVMIRRSALPKFDRKFLTLKVGDWPLFALAGQLGLIGYLDQNMATYRIHGASAWSSLGDERKMQHGLNMARFLSRSIKGEHRAVWREKSLWMCEAKLSSAARVKSLPGVFRAAALLGREVAGRERRYFNWYVTTTLGAIRDCFR